MAVSTVSRTGIANEPKPKYNGPVLNGAVWTTEVATTSIDEVGDIINMGYLPTGVTLLGFIIFADDLDSNGTPTLAYKISVGATDVKTLVTIGQAATGLTHTISSFVGVEPLAITAESLVKVTITTVSATPVAGTLCFTPVYLGN